MSTHYTRDLAVVGAGALLTVLLRSLSRRYLEAHFAEWPSLPQRHQSRLLVEIAVIPSRLALITLTVPIVVRGFTPLETWTAHDTDACLLAWWDYLYPYCTISLKNERWTNTMQIDPAPF